MRWKKAKEMAKSIGLENDLSAVVEAYRSLEKPVSTIAVSSMVAKAFAELPVIDPVAAEIRSLQNKGYTQKRAIEIAKAMEERGAFRFSKAGPYIGKRGGKWADPEHTIAWKEKKDRKGKKEDETGEPAPLADVIAGLKNLQTEAIGEIQKAHADSFKPLMEALQKLAPDAKIKGRVKKTASIMGKMQRKSKYAGNVGLMQDITGTRIVAKDIAGVKEVVESIRKKYKIVEEDNYIDSPKGDYRSHHLIILDGDLQKEVQIRTPNQNTFASWAHDIYKPTSDEQAAAIAKNEDLIKAYSKNLSAHFYAIDAGADVIPEKPPCIPAVKDSVGCV